MSNSNNHGQEETPVATDTRNHPGVMAAFMEGFGCAALYEGKCDPKFWVDFWPHSKAHADWVEAVSPSVSREAIRAEAFEEAAKVAEGWSSPLRPGTEARLLGHKEAARDIAAAIRALAAPEHGERTI